MTLFIEWAASSTPENDVEQQLVNELTVDLAGLKAALEDGNLSQLPRDQDVLDDLRAIEVIAGIPKLSDTARTKKDGKQRHGDAAIAIALAWFSASQDGGVIEYTPVPKNGIPEHTNPMRPNEYADMQVYNIEKQWR